MSFFISAWLFSVVYSNVVVVKITKKNNAAYEKKLELIILY